MADNDGERLARRLHLDWGLRGVAYATRATVVTIREVVPITSATNLWERTHVDSYLSDCLVR
jgi:hypothetical protein